jgi:hypothetical protein
MNNTLTISIEAVPENASVNHCTHEIFEPFYFECCPFIYGCLSDFSFSYLKQS